MKEYDSLHVQQESVRSRVAMDFTGTFGRIVNDPTESRAIEEAEGESSVKKHGRLSARCSTDGQLKGLEDGVHITQPWYHSDLSREEAQQLLTEHGTSDGVFLVRESRSTPGTVVLSYNKGSKIFHSQIQMIKDKEFVCCSLDNGKTKFYDILQLVEFYQLNTGGLSTKLTHYVTHKASPNSTEQNGATKSETGNGTDKIP